tara:strand:+ start:2088 stop:2390 length:303 start_codon:yes stop_codon:yes gene_type:complete
MATQTQILDVIGGKLLTLRSNLTNQVARSNAIKATDEAIRTVNDSIEAIANGATFTTEVFDAKVLADRAALAASVTSHLAFVANISVSSEADILALLAQV